MKNLKIYTLVVVFLMLFLGACKNDKNCLDATNKPLATEKKRLENEATERAKKAVEDYLGNPLTLTFVTTVEEPQLAENAEEVVYADKIALQFRFIASSHSEHALTGKNNRTFQVVVKGHIPLIDKCDFSKGMITEASPTPKD